MDPVQGRGWAVLEGEMLLGMFFLHLGDESYFVAERLAPRRSRSRRLRDPQDS